LNGNRTKFKDSVEPSDNPFDYNKKVVGLGNKKPKGRHQKDGVKLLERIGNKKDEEIKAAPRKYCEIV